MKHIRHFKNGDKITRIEALIEIDNYKNFTYVGQELTFLGIENATIYLKRKPAEITGNPFSILFGGDSDKPVTLPLELWGNGWDYYKEPDFLNTDEISLEEKNIQDKIQKAIDEQDFELAAKLTKKLNK